VPLLSPSMLEVHSSVVLCLSSSFFPSSGTVRQRAVFFLALFFLVASVWACSSVIPDSLNLMNEGRASGLHSLLAFILLLVPLACSKEGLPLFNLVGKAA